MIQVQALSLVINVEQRGAYAGFMKVETGLAARACSRASRLSLGRDAAPQYQIQELADSATFERRLPTWSSRGRTANLAEAGTAKYYRCGVAISLVLRSMMPAAQEMSGCPTAEVCCIHPSGNLLR
jgi:hypothetical protein